MRRNHPIEKKPEPVPHDPRNEPVPEHKPGKEGSLTEKAEEEARKEKGVGMKQQDKAIPKELRPEEVIVNPTQSALPTGIQTGQTARGSYSTDPGTGAGRYADHRAGTFGTGDVAQPDNDEEVEPDPIDPKL